MFTLRRSACKNLILWASDKSLEEMVAKSSRGREAAGVC